MQLPTIHKKNKNKQRIEINKEKFNITLLERKPDNKYNWPKK